MAITLNVPSLLPASLPRDVFLALGARDWRGAHYLEGTYRSQTPLMVAMSSWHDDEGDTALSLRLLDLGADPNARDFQGATALWHCANPVALLPALMQAGLDINAVDRTGESYLFEYFRRGFDHHAHPPEEELQVLLDFGMDPHLCRHDGTSAWEHARDSGWTRGIAALEMAMGNVRLRESLAKPALDITITSRKPGGRL
jgi:ankyrin repeat protein